VNSTPKDNQHESATKLPESRNSNQKNLTGDLGIRKTPMAMKPTVVDRRSTGPSATKNGQGRLRAKPSQWPVLQQHDFSPKTAEESSDSDTIVVAQRRAIKQKNDANEKSDSEDDVPLTKRARQTRPLNFEDDAAFLG
jgi:hypothetical protein